VENSKKLLSETKLSITKISELTGFNSSSNFARVFKKLTGISPVQYRKDSVSDNE
jgi:AraC-like DNA-binding protein